MFRKSLMLAACFSFAANVAVAQTVAAPAEAVVAGPPLQAIPIGNHYVCYPVKGPIFMVPFKAVFTDQFGSFGAMATKITRLCNPAKKLRDNRAYPMVDPNLHLVCYAIRPIDFHQRHVRTTDQFGTWTLTVLPPTEVCLPAAKTELPG